MRKQQCADGGPDTSARFSRYLVGSSDFLQYQIIYLYRASKKMFNGRYAQTRMRVVDIPAGRNRELLTARFTAARF